MEVNKTEIRPEISAEIEQHLRRWCKFIDNDTLKEEWKTGIAFLYDIGLVSLAQFADLYNMFMEG